MAAERKNDRITVDGVAALVVFADDPVRLASWYRERFEAKPLVESPGFIGLSLGRLALFIQRTGEGHHPGRGGVRAHLEVDDCRASFRALVDHGATQVLPPSDAGGETVAAVADPEGNPIGLLERKRNHGR